MPKQQKLYVAIIRKCLLPLITAGILAALYGTYVSRVRSELELNWYSIIDKAFFIIAIFILAYWVRMIVVAVFNWYAAKIAAKTHSKIDDDFIPLFKKIANIIVWIIALIIVLSYLGININALIATLGVGSLAIALAAQDTISNIIAGFLILIDRPFRVGDEIKLPTGEKVNVLQIGHRRSKFRAEDGSIVIVPNLDLSKSKIVNYTYGEAK